MKEIPEREPMTGVKPQQQQQQQSVVMKRQLGLLDGVALIVGSIVGSGIFISPKGVLQLAGSSGLAIIVWVLCGLTSLIGAICYAELGTMIDESGGNYAYLRESFGQFPAFVFMWAAIFIMIPVSCAINSLAFANYILQPIFGNCVPSDPSLLLVAALALTVLCVINGRYARWSARLHSVFMVAKSLALAIVVVTGCVAYFVQGEARGFHDPFANTSTDASLIALSFYSGLFSYAGWNSLNAVVEELKNPYTNLPRAITISLPIVTLVYVMANVAYLVVLTPEELVASTAVAVTFSEKVFGPNFTWIIQVLVALSALGSLHCVIFGSSRIYLVGARSGHVPTALALLTIPGLTPLPAVILMGGMAIFMLLAADVFILINYISFIDSFFTMAAIAGLLWLRWKQPDRRRPVRPSLVFPITFFVICTFLVFVPIASNPTGSVIGIAIMVTALPVFYLFIVKNWRNSDLMTSFNRKWTTLFQKVFLAVPEMITEKKY